MSINRISVARSYQEYGVGGVSSYISTGTTDAFNSVAGNAGLMLVRWDNGGGATGINVITDPSGSAWSQHPSGPLQIESGTSGNFIAAYYCTNLSAATGNQITVDLAGGTSSLLCITVVQYNSSTGGWSLDSTGCTSKTQAYNADSGNIVSPGFDTSGAGVVFIGIGHKYPGDTTSVPTILSPDTLIEKSATTASMWTGERLNQSSGQTATTVGGNLTGGGDVLGMLTISLVTTAGPAPTYEQEGFRFRNDDGSESTATWADAQDTSITRTSANPFRLRLIVNATNDALASQYQLEYKKSTDSTWSLVQPLLGNGAPTIGNVGTGATGTTSCAPTYPTGITSTQWLYCLVTGESSTASTAPTMPAGWTQVAGLEAGSGAFGVDTGPRFAYLFKKDTVAGTETGTVTVSLTGTTTNTLYASIFSVVPPTGYTLSASVSTGADTTAGTGVSVTSSGNIDFGVNDLLVVGIGQLVDNSTATGRSVSATGVTFGTITAQRDVATTQGNDHRHILLSVPVSSGSGNVATTVAYTASNATTQATAVFLRLRATPPTQAIILSDSANISAGGTTATTAQLTAPSGKTSGANFQTGQISDDTNPLPSLDLATDAYTELEWSATAQSGVVAASDVYQFRVTRAGTLFDTYTATPQLTISSSGINGGLTVTEGAETSSASAVVLVSGSTTANEAAATLSSTTGVLVNGSATVSEAGDTLSSTIGGIVMASATITEVADTLSSTGTFPIVSGSATISESAETISSTTGVLVTGSATITEAASTVSATASVPPNVTGVSSVTPARASTLTITGTNFGATQGAGTVTIGGVNQTVTSWSDTSIQVTVSRGTNKYGVALGTVVTNNSGVSSSSFNGITGLTPQSGWSYVNIGTPNTTSSYRITTTPDIASGDQLAYDNKGGLVTVADDATFTADPSVTSFDVEVWTTGGWGAVGTQSISIIATATIAEGIETVSSSGTVTGSVNASATITEAASTLSSATAVLVSGTSGITEASETATVAAGVLVSGGATTTEAAESLSSAATVSVSATATITETADTLASTISGAIGAVVVVTEAADSISATGVLPIRGSSVLAEAADTFTGAAVVLVSGSSSITEAADTLNAQGGASSAVANASLTESADTETISAQVTASASAGINESAETVASSVGVVVGGSSSLNEANETVSSTASVALTIVATINEGADTLVATAGSTTVINGSVMLTEVGDGVGSSGAVLVGGVANINEAANSISSNSVALVQAALTAVEASDSNVSTVQAFVQAVMSGNESGDVLVALGGIMSPVAADVALTEVGDSLYGVVRVLTEGPITYQEPTLFYYWRA